MFGKKYKYDYDYDEDVDIGEEGDENSLHAMMASPHKITKSDYLIALIFGVATFFFASLLMPKGLHPTAWIDCAQAAGLRPPTDVFPGLWRFFARFLYSVLGISAAGMALSLLGKISLGIIGASAYLSFKAILSLLIRKLPVEGFWNKRMARFLSLIAAFALICSDPVWMICQAFIAQTFLLLMFCAMTMMWIRFLRDGRLSSAYISMVLVGLFCAESPLGFLVLILYWVFYVILLRHGFLGQVKLANLFIKQNAKWYLTFCFGVGLLAGIGANILGFISADGLLANGLSAGDLPVKYITHIWHTIIGAASAGGWIVALGVAVMPFVLTFSLVCRATDIEHFLKYQVGLVFFVLICVAYSQLSSLEPLWFWTWIKTQEMVKSPLLLSVFAFMSSLTLLGSMAVLAIDAFCRNNRRIAQQFDPDSITVAEENGDSGHSGSLVFRVIVLSFFVCIIVAGLIPGRIQPTTDKMISTMRNYVNEIVNEAGDAKWIFTDGSFDCAIELEAAARGSKIACISLLPSLQARSIYSCRHTLLDNEDRLSMELGGSNLLRTWERDKPNRLADCAFQLGFEVWRRHGKQYPDIGGTCARAKGVWKDKEDVNKFILNGYKIAEEILSLYAAGGTLARAGTYVNNCYLFMQWRIARLARIRAEIFDMLKNSERSNEEVKIASALDDKNESLKRIIESMTRLKELTMRQMTPREGLQYALVRADFMLARRYAEPILDATPEDPNANFAMGMSFFIEKQWTRAEEYLGKCLRKNPKEPAIWNNLAVLQLRTGRLDEAKKNAQKALELIPDSAEVKNTLDQIEKAIQDKSTNKVVKTVKKVKSKSTVQPTKDKSEKAK